MHGLPVDSLDWFNVFTTERCALGTRLFDEGYQVYFGNVRGTPHSRTFSNGADATINEGAYFDFTLDELGDFDMQAMVKAAYQDYSTRHEGDCKKVSIIAHALGTTEVLVGLSQSPYAKNYISKAILLAPCPIPKINFFMECEILDFVDNLFKAARKRMIYSLFGPNWAD